MARAREALPTSVSRPGRSGPSLIPSRGGRPPPRKAGKSAPVRPLFLGGGRVGYNRCMSRRPGDFAPIGSVDLETTGMPRRQARALLLEHAWRRCAGASVARHVEAVRVVRGVLELRASDRAWFHAASDFLPDLLTRVVAEWPRLGVRKARVTGPDGEIRVIAPSSRSIC